MRFFVFTPTRLRGGLDVNHLSLERQQLDEGDSIAWAIQDEYYDERHEEMASRVRELTPDIDVRHYKRPIKDGYLRNLASGYTFALDLAKGMEADLFISLQDYFWLPPDAFSKLKAVTNEYPLDLITGVAHLMTEPSKADVRPEYMEDGIIVRGGYSVFKEDWWQQPGGDYFFKDPRPDGAEEPEYRGLLEWETNWAAAPKYVIDSDVRFSEDYDKGAAYENQDFAFKCNHVLGSGVIFDPTNIAWGVNHKRLWPEIEAADMPHLNHRMHAERWA